ncbi:helicase, putative [Ixodes scapularis]|uniref:Helicase, putative n=1 Tax=Ixodes scapularis TaxID=6945 RepID=B7PYN6_IXOSC|nr:helicase, putative [Ixodes scapularis]|eukprot:XP_002403427.1 helicase, putative [Ixodes scapularis]
MARRIARVTKDAKLCVDEDRYIESFKPHLMDVIYSWSKGASFAQVCKMTDVFEGECRAARTPVGILSAKTTDASCGYRWILLEVGSTILYTTTIGGYYT